MEKHDERRTRQLLLNKREIRKIRNDITLKRLTIIPYVVGVNSRGLIKIELYTAKGKKLHDKRETIKERDSQRESRIKY
jgi:SsrA-binding protein